MTFCCDHSRDVGESLVGTAPRITNWLLLESNGHWPRQALDCAGLPDPVAAWLRTQAEQPHTRAALIRRQPRTASDGIAFYVALMRESGSVLYEFQLAQYEDLLALDLPAVLAESGAYAAHRRTTPLYLVCIHRQRDVACAREGVPVFKALARSVDDGAAWQVSHVGGHRFAANLVVLPQGTFYGRVTVADVPRIVADVEAGRLVLDRLRGRAVYDAPVQAAEHFLRTETGRTALDDFRLDAVEQTAEHAWTVCFTTRNGAQHTICVAAEMPDFAVYKSTGDAEPVRVRQYVQAPCSQT